MPTPNNVLVRRARADDGTSRTRAVIVAELRYNYTPLDRFVTPGEQLDADAAGTPLPEYRVTVEYPRDWSGTPDVTQILAAVESLTAGRDLPVQWNIPLRATEPAIPSGIPATWQPEVSFRA